MKLIMTSGGLIVSIMLIIFIHLTVVSDNIIEHETNSSLNSSMDYAYDKMMDDYEDISFVEYYKSPCFVWFDSDGFIEHISKDNTYNNATGTYYEKGEDVLTDDLMKKFCEKKYVLFDFDGVIADTEESNGNYLGLALKEFGVELTQKDRDRLIGSHDSHILLELLERSPEKITMEQLLQKRKEIGNTYENGCIKPMEGLLEFIAGLKKQGKKLAVVSSTSTRLIVVALNRMKMLGLFDVVVCGDMCRNRKPDPECYRKAMQYLEAKPEECIAIEDSFIGIQAAKAANIEVVAYTGAGENQDVSQADDVISSYI